MVREDTNPCKGIVQIEIVFCDCQERTVKRISQEIGSARGQRTSPVLDHPSIQFRCAMLLDGL